MHAPIFLAQSPVKGIYRNVCSSAAHFLGFHVMWERGKDEKKDKDGENNSRSHYWKTNWIVGERVWKHISTSFNFIQTIYLTLNRWNGKLLPQFSAGERLYVEERKCKYKLI